MKTSTPPIQSIQLMKPLSFVLVRADAGNADALMLGIEHRAGRGRVTPIDVGQPGSIAWRCADGLVELLRLRPQDPDFVDMHRAISADGLLVGEFDADAQAEHQTETNEASETHDPGEPHGSRESQGGLHFSASATRPKRFWILGRPNGLRIEHNQVA